jgi:hydrogenase maturation protease
VTADHVTRTVVIGLGNPLLSDDAVGVVVARQLRLALGARRDVDVRELHVGGMALMEACVGYDRAVVIDAMVVAGHRPGTIHRCMDAGLRQGRNCACAHDTGLATALDLGRFLHIRLPGVIRVLGVEPADLSTFGEALTEEVARAVPIVVAEIIAWLDAADAQGDRP